MPPLDGKVIIVTGGEGLLGRQHMVAIREAGGVAISADVRHEECTDVTDP